MSTYRQIRRQTRRGRRAGLQPIVVIDSPFPIPVAVLLARLTWRYRSEIAERSRRGHSQERNQEARAGPRRDVIPNPTIARHLDQIGPLAAGLDTQATIGVNGLPLTPWQSLGVVAP